MAKNVPLQKQQILFALMWVLIPQGNSSHVCSESVYMEQNSIYPIKFLSPFVENMVAGAK